MTDISPRNNPQTRRKTTIFLLAFFFLLSAGFMVYYYKITREQPKKLRKIGNGVGPFSFTNQEGKTITDKDVAGKVRVVEYFYATCKGQCPKMNDNMVKVYDEYRYNDKVVIMSHTVDPNKDSSQALMAYSKKYNADPKHWMFLTGDKKALYDMARYGYFISAQDDTAGVSIDKDFIHDYHFILVDGEGYIRGIYDGMDKKDMPKLVADIKTLLDEK